MKPEPRSDNAWDDLEKAIALLRTRAESDSLSRPFHCEHDTLTVMVNPDNFTDDEIEQLDNWGFHAGEDEYEGYFYSFRYGSA